ncbi:CHAT domain-containing protein [Gordonia sputi]
MAREIIYANDVEHALSALTDTGVEPESTGVKLILEIAVSSIGQVADQRLRMPELVPADTREKWRSVPGDPDEHLRLLSSLCNDEAAHEIDPLAQSAAICALLYVVANAESDPTLRSEALARCAAIGHNRGMFKASVDVLEMASRFDHSIGFGGVFDFYRSQMIFVRSDPTRYEPLRESYERAFAAVSRKDPAARRVRKLALWIAHNNSGSEGLVSRAARAASREDYPEAAVLYGELAGETQSPDRAAAFRVMAEVFALRAGALTTPSDFIASMGRLADDAVTRARATMRVIDPLVDFFGAAKRLAVETNHPGLAAIAADFEGEIRLGVAIDPDYGDLTTATTSLTDAGVVDLMQRRPRILDLNDARGHFGKVSAVWVTLTHDMQPGHYGNYLTVTCLEVRTGACTSIEIALSLDEARAIENNIGAESETGDAAGVALIKARLEAGLDPEECTEGVYIIPCPTSWELPWQRLMPDHVTAFSLVPSLASASRLQPVESIGKPRIIVLASARIAGAIRERKSLQRLCASNLIELVEVDSFQELAAALRREQFDLLVISGHGSRSEGFDFTIDIGAEKIPLRRLLATRLPPVVSLGCCWSARSAQSNLTMVASLSCLLGGAQLVVGGLWDLDDAVSGTLMEQVYERFARSLDFPASFRSAYLDLPSADQPAAAGIALFGRL